MLSETHTLFKHFVTAVEEIADGKFLVRFDRQFDFVAGQVVAVALDPRAAPRLYSICSGEKETEMQLLFDRKDGGDLTPRLAAARAGDTLWVSRPYGSFLADTKCAMWWIATGTGIAPFVAMMRSGRKADLLLHGARDSRQFYFDSQFKETHGDKYIRCDSSKGDGGDYLGRVTTYLQSIDRFPAHVKYYVCGQPEMVVEVRDILIAKGVSLENIVAEIYF